MSQAVLDERREQILLTFKRFDYLVTRQVATLFGLNMKNAYRIMKQLEPYLNSFKENNTIVYYLNREGRSVVRCEKIRKKLTTAQHYIMRNDLYIHLGQPDTWRNEIRINYTYDKTNPKSRKITVVADAHFMTGDDRHHVVEIDNEQHMHKNKDKIEKYRRLTEKGVFRGMPEIIWVTTTQYRKEMLAELCAGLDNKVLLRSDLL